MFGERLERARKAAGLSLRALGEQVGLSQTAIAKYEKNQITPDSTMLIKLTHALNVKVEYFFRPKEFTYTLDDVDYRKRDISKKGIDLINAKILDQIEKRFELESFFPKLPIKPFELPKKLKAEINDLNEIDEIANQLRKSWKIGLSPIADLVDLLESNGIRVFIIEDSIDNKFDGLATKIKEQPIIVISSDWPGDRQRFTLAHELGHLVLHNRLKNELDKEEEKAADRFAGSFLLPTYAIKEELGEKRNFIEPRELSLLKQEYGISMQGVIFRATHSGIITSKQSGPLWGMFKKRGWLLKEPGKEYPSEESHIFKQLIFHALAEEFIGESKAAELMDMSVNQFYNFRMLDE